MFLYFARYNTEVNGGAISGLFWGYVKRGRFNRPSGGGLGGCSFFKFFVKLGENRGAVLRDFLPVDGFISTRRLRRPRSARRKKEEKIQGRKKTSIGLARRCFCSGRFQTCQFNGGIGNILNPAFQKELVPLPFRAVSLDLYGITGLKTRGTVSLNMLDSIIVSRPQERQYLKLLIFSSFYSLLSPALLLCGLRPLWGVVFLNRSHGLKVSKAGN